MMTAYTPSRRRPAVAPWTADDSAGLAAVLDAPRLHPLYTAGYAQWTPEALKATCDRLGALLLDIRMKPWSKRPEWQQPNLRALFGIGYRHEAMLGNINYASGGDIELADPAGALPSVRSHLARFPVVLLCGCKDWRTCHRAVAAEVIRAATGVEVIHLEPPAPSPVALSTLPDGYRVHQDGTVATLTLPSGGRCAFDGRQRTATGYSDPNAARALQAAHDEAQRHAEYAAHPPVVGTSGRV